MMVGANTNSAGSPASGERRAVRNLSAQYKVAAELALQALRNGDLEWVRLVDPEAGRLDDILIARRGRLDAYQIKWSDYRDTLTFRSLVNETRVSGKTYPAPIALMADGWQRLRGLHGDRRVHAHFLTHDAPSLHDKMDGQEGHSHLQAFLRHAFPARAQWFVGGDAVHASWFRHIDQLLDASGLGRDDFARFIADSYLDLGYDLAEVRSREAAARRAEVDVLASKFFEKVAASVGAVELARADILSALGWSDRFEFRFKHEFPVDETLYRPLAGTITRIEHVLANFPNGYAALIGPPGSGKSTTLTHCLRYRRGIKLIRYYAFVRDDPRGGRGEASAFLHDLCLALEEHGAGRSERFEPLPADLPGLREKVARLLSELASEARAANMQVVLLIDGLDHIEREQSPDRSLIEELPSPENVPDGVLILLGTQPAGLEGAPASLRPIRVQLEREPERKIEVDRLSRVQARELFEAVVAEEFRHDGDAHTAYRLSAGHPLALTYLLRRLASASNAGAVAQILDNAKETGGDVGLDYGAYWDLLADDAEVRDLLGLIARMRGSVDLDTIASLANPVVIERFARGAFHFFHELLPGRWGFFHNSFRLFLLDRSGRDAFGRPAPARDIEFHRRLADAANQLTPADGLHWDRLHHLERAGETAALLAEAGQALFRDQFLAGRPRDDLDDDIDRVMNMACEARDVVAFARMLFIRKELRDRRTMLDETDHIDLVIELAEEKQAVLLHGGHDLRVGDAVALRWSARLHARGETVLALRIFDAAEPLDELSGSVEASFHKGGAMEAWARAAWRFRPMADVIMAIGQVRAEYPAAPGSGDPGEEAEEWSRDVRRKLLVEVGDAILSAGEIMLFEEFSALLPDDGHGNNVRLRLDFEIARDGAAGLPTICDPVTAMRRIVEAYPPDILNPGDAALLAELAVGLGAGDDVVDAYLTICPDPIVSDNFRSDVREAFQSVAPLYAQARAAAASGRPIDVGAIADAEKDWDQGRVLIQRLVVLVGTFSGQALAGQTLGAAEVARLLRPLALFRRRSWDDITHWHDWSAIGRIAEDLAVRALETAHAYGAGAFHAAAGLFEEIWAMPRPRGGSGWPADAQRKIALAAYRIDGDRPRLMKTFERLEIELGAAWELYERADEYRDRAEVWLEIGENGRARAALDRLFAESFGVDHHKDRQIEDWAGWFEMLVDGGGASDLRERAIGQILPLIATLFENNRGRGAADAARTVLGAVARVDPGHALACGRWMLDAGYSQRGAIFGALLGAELASGAADRVAKAVLAISHILLPYEDYDHALAQAVGKVARSSLADDPAVARALSRYRMIANGRGQSGPHYLEELHGEGRAEKRKGGKAAGPTIVMTEANGAEHDQAGLEALASYPALLTHALAGARLHSGADWIVVIDQLFGQSRSADREAAIDAVFEQRLSFTHIERIAEQAVAGGDAARAERCVERLLKDGRAHGWSAYYDGGSRLAAARTMLRIDPAVGRKRAFALLVRDIREEGVDLGTLLGDFPALLPLIVEESPVEALWTELESHLAALVEVRRSELAVPSSAGAAADRCDVALALILRDLDDEAASLAWDARRGLIDLLRLGDESEGIAREIRSRLAGDIREQTAAIATLACLAYEEPDLARPFANDIAALAWAPSSVLRFGAQAALDYIGMAVPEAPPVRGLPAIYQLHLPKGQKAGIGLTGQDVDPSKPLPDTSDPYDLSRIYHPMLKALGKMSGFGFDRLVRRFAQLMETLAPADRWSADEEGRLTALNRAIGLQLSYRRPRSIYTQHAFGLLVSELWDAGAIDHIPPHAEPYLLPLDAPISSLFPAPRPDWIMLPAYKELESHPARDWIEAAAEALEMPDQTPDGRVILAEFRKSVNQDGERRSEARLSTIAPAALHFETGSGISLHSFQYHPRYAAADYPGFKAVADDAMGIAVAGGSSFAHSRFLAFNPLLGLHMGWIVARKGLFRWVDAKGRTMVEAVAWAEGNCALHSSGMQRSLASEGWLILASRDAWAALLPELHGFVRHRIASRRSGLHGQSRYGLKVVGTRTDLV